MNAFDRIKQLFNSRAKKRDFKVLRSGTLRLYGEGEGYVAMTGWETQWTELARISSEGVMTLLREIPANGNSEKNAVRFLTDDRVTVYSHSTCKFVNKVRFSTYTNSRQDPSQHDFPCVKGLQYDLVKGVVVNPKTDIVRRTDRAAAKPVHEHAKKVLQMMDLLVRMDAMTPDVKKGVWRDRYNALAIAKALPLEEDAIVEQAELAYKQATARVGGYFNWNGEYAKEAWYARVRDTAKRHLVESLKQRNGAYYTQEATTA